MRALAGVFALLLAALTLPVAALGQSLFPPAGAGEVYTPQPTGDVFRRQTFVEPDFLPPEAWNSHSDEFSDVQPTQYPFDDSAARDLDPVGRPTSPYFHQQPQMTPETGSGWLWKEAAFTATVIPGFGDDFGWTSLDWRATGYYEQLPMVQFLPRFSWHFLDGPAGTDVPSHLYDFALDTLLFVPVGDQWSFLAMVGPAMFSDFDNTSSDAFRVTGRIMAFYQWSNTVKLSGGFLYLGREDVQALPAGGVVYTPHDAFKAEILFPKPKVAWRTYCVEDKSRWVYLAGEFGGNSWAIQRAGGADDVLTIRDLRLIAGVETIHTDSFRWLVEAGFVFGRRLEYRSTIGDSDQDPTALLRGGMVF